VFDQEENHIDLMEIFHAQSIEQVLPVQDLPPLMKEFVLACVALDPKDRVIAEVLLYSPWIQQFDIVEPHSYVTAVNIVRLWMDSLSDEWTQGRVKLEGDHLRSTFPSSSGSEDGDESATELCGSVSDIGLFSPRSTPATPLSPWSPAPVASTSWGDTDSSRPSVGVPTADCSSSAVPSHVHQAHEPIVGTE
jgi:serine/threonine protein kinase